MSGSRHTSATPPWKTGYWVQESRPSEIAIFTQGGVTFFHINWLEYPDICPATENMVEIGDFGPAREEVVAASGSQNYNLKLHGKHKCVISSDGTEIFQWSNLNRVEKLKWVSEQHLANILEDRDSFDSPRYVLNSLKGRAMSNTLHSEYTVHLSIPLDLRNREEFIGCAVHQALENQPSVKFWPETMGLSIMKLILQ